MSRHALRKLAALALSAFTVISGCRGSVGTTASHAPSVADLPGPTTNPWLADDRIAQAIEFRMSVGLRSDEAWVREVADDPAAAAGVLAYNVPLLPVEVEAVKDRYTDLHAILDIFDEYGALHPSEWAGATQDPSTNSVTARFTANLPDHRANLMNWLPPGARVNLVQVRWTLLELEGVRDRISNDWESNWLLDNDIYPLGLGVNPSANQVELEVSSARADLDPFLEDRYNAPTMLTISSDGTGVRLLPKGTLAGVVVDAEGKPVAGVSIELASSVAGAGPHGDVGHGTNDAGRFRIERIEAVTYTVLVFSDAEIDTRKLLGSSEPVTVVAGTTTNVRVVLP
jgi:hypothetical protein